MLIMPVEHNIINVYNSNKKYTNTNICQIMLRYLNVG